MAVTRNLDHTWVVTATATSVVAHRLMLELYVTQMEKSVPESSKNIRACQSNKSLDIFNFRFRLISHGRLRNQYSR